METKKQSNILLMNETKLFYKFAVPNILSLVLLSSAGIVDAIFIGNYVGEISLAAVNTANPVFSFIWGLSMMVMIGGAVAAGKYFGEKNIKAANEVFTNSIIAVFLITVVVSLIIFIFTENIIMLIGGSEKTTPIAALYLKIIIPFILFTTIGYGLSIFARVDGFPVIASFALITGALTNILLDALFIAVLNMGVKGAAYATGISFIVSFMILFIHFLRKKGNLRFLYKVRNFSHIIKTSYNGLSEFLNEISVGITMALFNITMMKYAKEEGVAAFTAINYIMWLGNMINYAAADTLNPLISTNYGAGKFNRIKNILKTGAVFTLINGLGIFITILFFGEQLTAMFIKDTSSKAFTMAVEFMSYEKWAFFLSGINMILASYFTAMLQPRQSAIIASLRSLIMPYCMLMMLPALLGITGIYIAIPVSETITFIVAFTLFILSSKFLLKR